MYNEIVEIETEVVEKKALVIDKEVEWCALLKFYLSKKNYNATTAYNLRDSLHTIENEKPDLIIADHRVHDNLENLLNEKIDSIEGYWPEIIIIGNTRSRREGAVMYTLRRHEDDDLNSKLKRIINYIKDLLR